MPPLTTDLYALNGPALTRLAYALHLAPGGTRQAGARFLMPCPSAADLFLPWCPHADLAQADAVFRQLRAHGFETMTQARERRGVCQAWSLDTTEPIILREWTLDSPCAHQERSEAMALLRVTVLALAG